MAILTAGQIYEVKGPLKHRRGYKNDYLLAERIAFVNNIKEGEGVIATFDYLAALSGRRDLYGFHKVYADIYQEREHPFTTPPAASKAIIDFHDRFLISAFWHDPVKTSQRLQAFFSDGSWQVKDAAEHIVYLERVPAGSAVEPFAGLASSVEAPFGDVTVKTIDAGLGLAGLKLGKQEVRKGEKVPVELLYAALSGRSLLDGHPVQAGGNDFSPDQAPLRRVSCPAVGDLAERGILQRNLFAGGAAAA